MNTVRQHSRRFRKHSLILFAFFLLGLSFLTSWYFNSTLSVGYQQKSLQQYVTEQQQDAQRILRDTMLMRKLVQHKESKEEFERLTGKPYGLFLFAETLSDNQELLFWNSQKINQPKVEFDSMYDVRLQRLLNGYYITQKERLQLEGMSNHVIAFILIPVLHKYYLETENSQTVFAHNKYATNRIAIADQPTAFPIHALNGTTLFYVQQMEATAAEGTDPVSVVFRLIALVLLLIALHLYAESIVQKKGAVKGILFLGVFLLLIRAFLFYLPAVFALRQVPLFDPTIFGSGLFNRSLGELLINSILLCWLILFAWYRLGPVQKLPSFLSGKRILVAGVAAVFLLLLMTFQLASIVHQLLVDSRISFEVTDFAKLNIYTWFSFLALALLSLSYYFFSRLLFRFILIAFPNLFHIYFTVALVGLLFLTFRKDYAEVLFYLPVLAWLIVYTLLLTQEQSIINRFRITIAGLLFWVLLFSVSLAALIMQGNSHREKISRRDIARKMDELTDPNRQTALTISLRYLDNRYLLGNFHRFYRQQENTLMRDSITNTGLADYNLSYNTSIYVFDSLDRAINNPDPTTYEELNNIYTTHSQRLNDKRPELVHYETSPSRYVYLVKREVFDTTAFVGTFFIVATPKQFQGREPFYPDIFTRYKNRFDDPSLITAIYRENVLVQYSGNYPFNEHLDPRTLPDGEYVYRENGDYNELWFKANKRKIIVVARKKETLIESITLFSYLFCAFLFMVGIIRIFELSAIVARTWPKVDIFSRMNIRSQIHVTIIFISVLSFFIIGVATISYFIQRNKRENTEELYSAAASTLDEIEKQAKEQNLVIESGVLNDSTTNAKLEKLITDISNVHGRIVNLYDMSGILQITSDDKIYNRGVLSKRMDPVAFYHLKTLHEVQKVQDEYIGEFQYLSIYKKVKDSSQQTIGYLNIPYFNSQIKTKQEISNFLITIINLNAFIILIAGVIALFITNRITRSFSVIGDKMKAITLGRRNEVIEWNKADEIGELVNQYNKMVQQLEESASALAKSEREGAWREMARQVAHEIKNPLTPMKLSIQYLQKAIQNNQPNVKDLTTSVASTLIEQIDHLSKIAADFSQFANIGNKRVEEIDLHNVIGSLLDLYSANPKIEVTWNPVLVDALMRADKTQMNRLFTNLLTNAVDACSERQKCVVVISEQLVGNNIQISISDNGDGIPKEMQSKIFMPNFTTKTSGTGLGLAMCKGIVEQAGGRIWFQTVEGQGTTFFVQLPLVAQLATSHVQ